MFEDQNVRVTDTAISLAVLACAYFTPEDLDVEIDRISKAYDVLTEYRVCPLSPYTSPSVCTVNNTKNPTPKHGLYLIGVSPVPPASEPTRGHLNIDREMEVNIAISPPPPP